MTARHWLCLTKFALWMIMAAIPAFEDVTLKGPQAANEKNTAVKRLSLAFLTALNKMQDDSGDEFAAAACGDVVVC